MHGLQLNMNLDKHLNWSSQVTRKNYPVSRKDYPVPEKSTLFSKKSTRSPEKSTRFPEKATWGNGVDFLGIQVDPWQTA